MNKRVALAVLCTIILASGAIAQPPLTLAELYPKDARSMGMGGSFRSLASGYQAFFGNPAGFSGPATLTFADLSAWGYFRPNPSTIQDLAAIAQGDLASADAKARLGDIIAKNGLGAGSSFGLGWSGKGFGLGLNFVSDSLATGTDYDDALTLVRNQANAIVGIALPLELGPFAFNLGIDVRAFYRLDSGSAWPFAALADAFIDGSGFNSRIGSLPLSGGFGLAVDSGAILALGPFSAGVMIRDYGYEFSMGDTTVGDLADTLELPPGGDSSYRLVPHYAVGMGLSFKTSKAVGLSFSVESDDPRKFAELAQSDFGASLETLHSGVQIELLKIVALRGGYNQGLLSFGLGLDLALIEIDAAIFSEPLADLSGSPSRSGLAIQAALRF
ncbi:MAG: hypothetical protein CVV53_01375 [Spirochaetae bacterium HGW-Spirochaetae-9]|nr:MAG: hypothetical protein CVV53_01375 [Spirochaetae bacterium HGW-Spirochaetae-9]